MFYYRCSPLYWYDECQMKLWWFDLIWFESLGIYVSKMKNIKDKHNKFVHQKIWQDMGDEPGTLRSSAGHCQLSHQGWAEAGSNPWEFMFSKRTTSAYTSGIFIPWKKISSSGKFPIPLLHWGREIALWKTVLLWRKLFPREENASHVGIVLSSSNCAKYWVKFLFLHLKDGATKLSRCDYSTDVEKNQIFKTSVANIKTTLLGK